MFLMIKLLRSTDLYVKQILLCKCSLFLEICSHVNVKQILELYETMTMLMLIIH